MRTADFSSTGFSIVWHFFDEGDRRYENYLIDKIANENIFVDLYKVLRVCEKYELLFPEYYMDDSGAEVRFQSGDCASVVDTIKRNILAGEIQAEITRIGGYGLVNLSTGEKVKQDNLISIDSIRFFERKFSVFTNKSIWTPLCIDTNYKFEWQIELARLNSERLENCLWEIYDILKIDVYPGPKEIDKEYPIWMSGFKLFVNPEILKRAYLESKPTDPFDLERYLIECPK